MYQWDTLKEIGPHELQYLGKPVPGTMCEVELVGGKTIRVWRSADGTKYFCHGLTFGGKEAPGGAISPYTGKPVETILEEHYQMIPEEQARAGDILVWRGIAPETTPHSAVLTDPVLEEGKRYLAYTTRLQSKNGLSPEMNMTLEQLIGIYGESYNAYRRR
jgi:hypothetical protein